MSNTDSSLHIYQRTVGSDDHDSLSVIAQMIQPGQTLLDLGMGTGGLGKYLSQHQPIVADGITLNQAEANIAKEWYRNALVADLDQDNIETLFGTNRYDCIVCADVLEHLKNPQNLLTQCVTLLKPGGRLLTSVPNASYCGLVAELVQGDFRYRQEGLLDNTHLRFFTRKSLKRFFDENGWATQSTQITTRSLLASEFRVAFDTLPPAVARYLLALPDALTYQFISVLQPASAAQPSSFTSSENDNFKTESLEPANALFSAQLYLAVEDHYNEAKKLVAPGRIGEPLQTLVFNLPACQKPYTRVRLDPADRPGFFKLHYMRLWLPDGTLAWQWQAGQDPLAIFINAPQHDMVISAPWEMSTSAMFLLHGEDPWVELPLASDLLQKIARSGAKLEVCAGWPMSADYLQASMTINTLQAAHEQSHMSLTQENQRINKQQVQFEQTLHVLQTQLTDANQAMHSALSEKQALISELDSVRHQTQAEEQRLTGELQTTRQIAQTEKQRLITDLHALQQEAQTEKQRLTNELRTTQRARNLAQDQFNQIALHVQSIERSTMFRVTRPLSHMKGRVDRLLGRGAPQGAAPQPGVQAQAIARSVHPVDIIVPVYRGLEDTRRCLESVLAAPGKTVWRLIVINDCSPEPEVTEWLRAFA
jgi:2-polyprenyl-3-methyl-5-hydroxy-6-metoxy-1,4-benzoquinol methylase